LGTLMPQAGSIHLFSVWLTTLI